MQCLTIILIEILKCAFEDAFYDRFTVYEIIEKGSDFRMLILLFYAFGVFCGVIWIFADWKTQFILSVGFTTVYLHAFNYPIF